MNEEEEERAVRQCRDSSSSSVTKRQRSDPPTIQPQYSGSSSSNHKKKEESRDCYESVVQGVFQSDLGTVENDGVEDPFSSSASSSAIRSSWLLDVEPFRLQQAFDSPTATSMTIGIQEEADEVKEDVEEDDDDDVENEEASCCPLREEILSLSRQLAQVKRRLGPAAERCTEAVNASHGEVVTTGSHEFVEARRSCNPFECLGEGKGGGLNTIFMNRSAIKLANIDALLNFSLTTTTFSEGEGVDSSDGGADGGDGGGGDCCFRFADLCGAPGGFSEYLLRRCSATRCCCGYGMSLLGRNEHGMGLNWRLEPTSSLHVDDDDDDEEENGIHSSFRICYGADGTGDIFNWKNVVHFKSMILSDSTSAGAGGICNNNHSAAATTLNGTPRSNDHDDDDDVDDDITSRRLLHRLVHLVVADGGVDAQRDAENQEEITQKLVVCQASVALELLQPGGTFLIKLFGCQTPVIRKMMQDLVGTFDSMVALKPITSRPASAERFFVFTGFKGCPAGWCGPRWQSRVFLGTTSSSSSLLPPSSLCERDAKRLGRYLDQIDRDMLHLNLKTCFSILSYLELKCLNNSRSDTEYHHSAPSSSDELDATTTFAATSPSFSSSYYSLAALDIDAYRDAWRLKFKECDDRTDGHG